MTGKKILLGLIIMILIAASASVFAQAAKKTCVVTSAPKDLCEKKIEKKVIMRGCCDDLGLRPEQQIKMIDIKFDHQLEILTIKKELLKKEIELKVELDKENPDKVVLEKIADDMALLQAKMKKSDLRCILAAKALLTKEQWMKGRERIIAECMGPGPCHEGPEMFVAPELRFIDEEEPEMIWKGKDERRKVIKIITDGDEPIQIPD